MKARERLRAARKAALAVTAAGVLAITAGGGVAEAATSSDLLYSTDGGSSWSSSATVAPGQTVLVRQWYDNDGEAGEQGASLTTTIPGPFTLNGGSTQVCLNPSTTNPAAPNSSELVCEDSAEGAVWSGKDLQVSPIAGHYGAPNGETTGTLPFGRVRYLNLHECAYRNTVTGDRIARIVGLGAGTNASNTQQAWGDVECGDPSGNPNWAGYTYMPQLSGAAGYDLLGNRYLNLHECGHYNSTGDNVFRVVGWGAGTNASNTQQAWGDVECGDLSGNPSWPGYTYMPQLSGAAGYDLLDSRYLNLHECGYRNTAGDRVFRVLGLGAGTNASNTQQAWGDVECQDPPTNNYWSDHTFMSQLSGANSFDLLDTARGHGYVQYAISAPDDLDAFCASNPSNPLEESYTQDGTLTSTPSGARASSGDLTIVWGDDPANPPCESSIPMIDPQVGGIVAGLAVVAGAAYVLHRRRVATI